jgi:hypothetical protein
LEEWRRQESNEIIMQEILPIVEGCSEEFMAVLVQAQEFVS